MGKEKSSKSKANIELATAIINLIVAIITLLLIILG